MVEMAAMTYVDILSSFIELVSLNEQDESYMSGW
jgi:hypothetical protein